MFLGLFQAIFAQANSVESFSPDLDSAVNSRCKFSFDHSETSGAWGIIGVAGNDNRTLNDVTQAIQNQLGRPDEMMNSLRGDFCYRKNFNLRLEVSQDAFVIAHNPVVPELRGSNSMMGLVGLQYDDLFTLWLGGATESYINLVSTDLLDHPLSQRNRIYTVGFDLDFQRTVNVADNANLNMALQSHNTFYNTSINIDWNGVSTTQAFTNRWKVESAYLWRVDTTEFGPEIIAGQQPVPIDMLPRVWDYVHQIDFLPEAQTLLAGEMKLVHHFSGNKDLTTEGGFYGGYVGGDVSYSNQSLVLTASSFGIETSSFYQALGERFWELKMSLLF